MRLQFRTIVAATLLWTPACALNASEVVSQVRQGQIDALVQSALAADLADDSSAKERLLDRALAAEPNAAAPHWHKGEVWFAGQWRTVAEAEALSASDPLRQEYRERCSAAAQTVDDQTALGTWCDAQGLTDEARVHWQAALRLDPSHAGAQRRLGLTTFQGGLFTKAQIAQIEAERAERKKDFEKFSLELSQWLREASSGDDALRQAIVERFRDVREPKAMAALEDAATVQGEIRRRLNRRLGEEKCEQFISELQCAVVSALAGMPQHEATVRLTEIAVLADRREVRKAAAEALRARPDTDYMPTLMGLLESPIEAAVDATATRDGSSSVGATLVRRGPLGEQRHHMSRGGHVPLILNFDLEINPIRYTEDVANSAAATRFAASVLESRIAEANQSIEERNRRIIQTLRLVTGEDLGTSPDAWWTAWTMRNELDLSYESPVVDTYDVADQVQYAAIREQVMASCFAAGTPVWTPTGPKAIDHVQVNEVVLSQDPNTGELAYRPVVQTTVRLADRALCVDTGSDEIIATPGHRFWVAGDGWQMAKFLQPKARLCALEQDAIVRDVTEHKGETVYNLVVDEFHTYFVGRDRVLVHDVTCPLPTRAALPGLSKDAPPLQPSAIYE